MQIFTQHAYVPKTKITDKGSAFTSQVMTEIMKEAGIHIGHATVKHAQTIDLVERTHQKLKQIMTINVAADTPNGKNTLTSPLWHITPPTTSR